MLKHFMLALISLVFFFTGCLSSSASMPRPARLLKEDQLTTKTPLSEIDFGSPELEQWVGSTRAVYAEQILELNVNYADLDTIEGLQYCTNLQRLLMDSNRISDLTPLTGLTKLEVLALKGNQISDISALSDLVLLRALNLEHNQIRDLNPLQNLTTLENLWISDNQIEDLTPLSNLTQLNYLTLANNRISNPAPLFSLRNLEQLLIQGNYISLELQIEMRNALPDCGILLE